MTSVIATKDQAGSTDRGQLIDSHQIFSIFSLSDKIMIVGIFSKIR